MKIIKELIFQNGDKIIFNKTGNTYIGELANKVMFLQNKFERKGLTELEFYNDVIIPNTNGLVIIK
jgi:hypothetical protein